jgi:hypothetical protein
MEYNRILFSGHAVRQMFSRGILKADVLTAIRGGTVILEYPDDTPYPSRLILGFVNDIPLHVVFAVNKEQQIGIVITAYIPDPLLWSENFKLRRHK